MSNPAIEKFRKSIAKNLSASKKVNIGNVEKRATAAIKNISAAQQANNKSDLDD